METNRASVWMRWITVGLVVATTAGCAVNRQNATVDPSAHFATIRTMHVVKLAEDDRGVNVDIADRLRQSGYIVTTDETKPRQIDALVTYNDRWMWDITMYLLQLNVTVRDAKNDYPLATGESLHTSLTRKSQKEMVDEVVNNILKKAKTS